MNRTPVVLIAALFAATLAMAQDQLENPGFELWEDILIGASDTIREPAHWSSLKTSDDASLSTLAPVVCKRGFGAHSGNYCVQLTNIMTLIVANGAVTNGRVHPDLNTSLAYMFTDPLDAQWNTPFTYRPDSIAGWFKYNPQSNDILQVKVILHGGIGKQPDADSLNNWVGVAQCRSGINTGSQWVRFSAPFIYYSDKAPEYVLVVLNSGNGFNPKAGSIAWFDDLEMIYNSTHTGVKDALNGKEFVYVSNDNYLIIKESLFNRYNTVSIMDITGRLTWSGAVASDRIDISDARLKKGIYLVSLTGENISITGKIIIP